MYVFQRVISHFRIHVDVHASVPLLRLCALNYSDKQIGYILADFQVTAPYVCGLRRMMELSKIKLTGSCFQR